MSAVHDPSIGRGVARFVGVDMTEVGDWERGEVVLEAEARVGDHLRGPDGGLLTGALLTMCDNVAGFCGGLAALPDGWVVSTNLMVRRGRLALRSDRLTFRSTVLRRGRSAAVTDVVVADSDGPIAVGMLTSAVLVPAEGVPRWERPARLHHVAGPEGSGGPEPGLEHFSDWLGLRAVADPNVGPHAVARGVEIDVFDGLRNPWGIVHGGVTASLIDAAGLAAVAGPGVVTDATVHFLAPARIGPVVANGTVLGTRADGDVVRIEVRDAGQDRTTAVAVCTVQRR